MTVPEGDTVRVPERRVYDDRELLELFRMLLRTQIREERINSFNELHGLLKHVEEALAEAQVAPDRCPICSRLLGANRTLASEFAAVIGAEVEPFSPSSTIRADALEEAAKLCDLAEEKHGDDEWDAGYRCAAGDLADRIRSLKTKAPTDG